MAANEPKSLDMQLLLLQEAVWNNGDALKRILEHVIALESHLVKLSRRIEALLQRSGLLNGRFQNLDANNGRHPDS